MKTILYSAHHAYVLIKHIATGTLHTISRTLAIGTKNRTGNTNPINPIILTSIRHPSQKIQPITTFGAIIRHIRTQIAASTTRQTLIPINIIPRVALFAGHVDVIELYAMWGTGDTGCF